MLNQWHFKGNQAGSCQPVVTSYSEAEAPQWRSLCWKQRCERFSTSLFCFFLVSLYPVFASAPHQFSEDNAIFRSLPACHQCIPGVPGEAPWAPRFAWTLPVSWERQYHPLHCRSGGPGLPSTFTGVISKSIYFLSVGAKLAPVTMKTFQSNEKNEGETPDKNLRKECWTGLISARGFTGRDEHCLNMVGVLRHIKYVTALLNQLKVNVSYALSV